MKKLIPVYVRVPVLFTLVFLALEYFIDSGDKPAFLKYPMVSIFLFVFLFIQIAIEIVISAMDKITYAILTDEQKKKLAEEEAKGIEDSEWYKKLKIFFGKPKQEEDEGALLLDHDYDGIKELDNVLPPWWVYLFYGTVLFAVIYLVRFHIYGDYTQKEEFETEMAEARLAVEEYKKTAKDLVDANTVTLLTDAGDLAQGKTIFETNCAACHRADGGGGIGPNLTDEFWVLGGGIKNVFHTISEGGRDGKGMVAWKGTLKPSEIQLVASYVLSLQGTNPADAKAPDGEIWKEEGVENTEEDTEETNATEEVKTEQGADVALN
ncbi:cytochrome C oxidase subunit III [Flavobacterium arcticum]|uniref:Cytochrome C oxidase subunit III n=1 Tax=Flavobacterium arcticum TaxID=1784713 RepID=A0A345H8I2_9FLAO|nr:cbb3-type cytochrome c oxidase N-terminal domain-containing protein [Flavobacterium arcticum]AXG72892.1 cytochrome C oxidase subunit III [Flavobacterium arcticum]KAF2510443.1 c-type cytochrome [Flavobacterium arcticum]